MRSDERQDPDGPQGSGRRRVTWRRVVLIAVIAVVVLVVLFTWVFPWLERSISNPTLQGAVLLR